MTDPKVAKVVYNDGNNSTTWMDVTQDSVDTDNLLYGETATRNNGDSITGAVVTADPATATPSMDGTGAVGISTKYAREDHVHPSDTSRAAASHSHGDITNSGDITATAPTIASGDKLIINDESASKITNGPSFGTSTTTYLRNDGSWATPASAVTSVNTKTGAVILSASDVSAATSDHSHGNITNGGDITATAPTIANGDQIVINDNSASKITNGPTFDGSTTSKYLSQKGSWENIPDISGKIDTAGTGLSKSGTTLNHSNSVTAQTTQAVYPIKIDAQGHISAYGSAATIPTASTTNPSMDGTASYGSGTSYARSNHVHPTDTSRAPLASPALTGTPTAPTAASGTNTTQIATTAFVQDALSDVDVLPSQTGQSGKFLTTNGTSASWAVPDNAYYVDINGTVNFQEVLAAYNAERPIFGKMDTSDDEPGVQSDNLAYLSIISTNGSDHFLSFTDYSSLPGYLTLYLWDNTNGWEVSLGSLLPPQTGENGKFLTTDGGTASWDTPSYIITYGTTITQAIWTKICNAWTAGKPIFINYQGGLSPIINVNIGSAANVNHNNNHFAGFFSSPLDITLGQVSIEWYSYSGWSSESVADVQIAYYGTTTLQEIYVMVNGAQIDISSFQNPSPVIKVLYNNRYYDFVKLNTSGDLYALFSCVDNEEIYYVQATYDGTNTVWTNWSAPLDNVFTCVCNINALDSSQNTTYAQALAALQAGKKIEVEFKKTSDSIYRSQGQVLATPIMLNADEFLFADEYLDFTAYYVLSTSGWGGFYRPHVPNSSPAISGQFLTVDSSGMPDWGAVPSDSTKQDKITANGLLQGDGAGNITAVGTTSATTLSIDNTPTASSSNLVTSGGVYSFVQTAIEPYIESTSLLAADWVTSTGAGNFKQTLAIDEVTATNRVEVSLNGSLITSAQYQEAAKAQLLATAQSAGQITIEVMGNSAPTINIPILVTVY